MTTPVIALGNTSAGYGVSTAGWQTRGLESYMRGQSVAVQMNVTCIHVFPYLFLLTVTCPK